MSLHQTYMSAHTSPSMIHQDSLLSNISQDRIYGKCLQPSPIISAPMFVHSATQTDIDESYSQLHAAFKRVKMDTKMVQLINGRKTKLIKQYQQRESEQLMERKLLECQLDELALVRSACAQLERENEQLREENNRLALSLQQLEAESQNMLEQVQNNQCAAMREELDELQQEYLEQLKQNRGQLEINEQLSSSLRSLRDGSHTGVCTDSQILQLSLNGVRPACSAPIQTLGEQLVDGSIDRLSKTMPENAAEDTTCMRLVTTARGLATELRRQGAGTQKGITGLHTAWNRLHGATLTSVVAREAFQSSSQQKIIQEKCHVAARLVALQENIQSIKTQIAMVRVLLQPSINIKHHLNLFMSRIHAHYRENLRTIGQSLRGVCNIIAVGHDTASLAVASIQATVSQRIQARAHLVTTMLQQSSRASLNTLQSAKAAILQCQLQFNKYIDDQVGVLQNMCATTVHEALAGTLRQSLDDSNIRNVREIGQLREIIEQRLDEIKARLVFGQSHHSAAQDSLRLEDVQDEERPVSPCTGHYFPEVYAHRTFSTAQEAALTQAVTDILVTRREASQAPLHDSTTTQIMGMLNRYRNVLQRVNLAHQFEKRRLVRLGEVGMAQQRLLVAMGRRSLLVIQKLGRQNQQLRLENLRLQESRATD